MKYLRFFSYESEYQDFLTSDEYVEPYVCAVLETDKVYDKQLVLSPANVGDIAYWDGCYNYKDATNGADKLQWYLPAMGELGFLITRFKLIEDSIKSLGYMGFPSSEGGRYAFWSSSECGKQSAYGMFSDGYVGNLMKTRMYNVCAFAAIEL